jgi:hypothetical protein
MIKLKKEKLGKQRLITSVGSVAMYLCQLGKLRSLCFPSWQRYMATLPTLVRSLCSPSWQRYMATLPTLVRSLCFPSWWAVLPCTSAS